MTYYLSQPGEDVSFTGSELADTFNVDDAEIADGDINDVIDLVAMAIINMDDLMGDDPVKYDGMQQLATALAILEEDGEGEIRTKYDASTFQMSIEKTPR